MRVFFYFEERERTLDSQSRSALADGIRRRAPCEEARYRVTDAVMRKAHSGHVCVGQCFAYAKLEITAQTRRGGCTGSTSGARWRPGCRRPSLPY